MRTPKRMFLPRIIKELAEQGKRPAHFFASSRYTAIDGMSALFKEIVSTTEGPFVTDDYRIGLLLRGGIDATVNLSDYHLTPVTMAYIEPGSIVQPNNISDDVVMTGIALSQDFLTAALGGRFPEAMDGKERNYYIKVSEEEAAPLRQIIRCVIDISHRQRGNTEAVEGLVAALAHYVSGIITERQRASQQAEADNRSSNGHDIFERFMRLVHKTNGRERKLRYYADRLCLTERYLGTVVRQVSGITAKEWIDRSTVTAARVMLLHSDLNIGQIADRLCFPTDSFFCKYFKRITGKTPSEERNN